VSEPVVRLTEVVKDDAITAVAARGQDDGGRGVGLGRDPGAVERVRDEEG